MRATDAGFSLLELAMTMGLMMTVTASVFALLNPAHGVFSTQSERADMQQRLRVAADALQRDLLMAGAGSYVGASAGAVTAGPLVHSFAPVLPFGQGFATDDEPGTYRSDRITILYVPSTTAQSTLAADLTPSELTLTVNPDTNCPKNLSLCGIATDQTLLVYDDTGNYDTFLVNLVDDVSAQLSITKAPDAVTTTYKAGSRVVEAVTHTYFLKTNAATQVTQLMRSDGSTNAGVPIADNVVGLRFDYDGDPQPPVLIRPVTDPRGPWTTYGPKPPAPGARTTTWPAGENCAFHVDAASGRQVSRLIPLGTSAALVRLSAAQLTDGPWCPDEASANRWDADLLRIRRIGVTLRLQSAAAALRGPAGVFFSHGGTSRAADTWVPDLEVQFQVTPRNLGLGR